MLPYGRKNPLPFPYFEAVTCRQSAPDYPRERGDSQEGGNRRCLPSCAPARRQRTFRSLLKRRLYIIGIIIGIGEEKTMFKTKLDELGFLLAYPLQIFVVGSFCRFVFYGRMGARTHIFAEG